MAKFHLRDYVASYRISFMRWLVVGVIIGSVFLADFMLKRDVAEKVGEAWKEACISGMSVPICLKRIENSHQDCFDPAYTSMLMRFGASRWESLDISMYEQCMELGADQFTVDDSDNSSLRVHPTDPENLGVSR